jgi:hypothetical protein
MEKAVRVASCTSSGAENCATCCFALPKQHNYIQYLRLQPWIKRAGNGRIERGKVHIPLHAK